MREIRMNKETDNDKETQFYIIFQANRPNVWKERKTEKTQQPNECSCSRALLYIKNKNCHAQHITHVLAAANQACSNYFILCPKFVFLFHFHFCLLLTLVLLSYFIIPPTQTEIEGCLCVCVLSGDNNEWKETK